eukprot:462674-Amphidinium_carterae.1
MLRRTLTSMFSVLILTCGFAVLAPTVRLSTSYLMDPIGVVARLLTASVSEVGSVEMEIVATVPAGSGQTQVRLL